MHILASLLLFLPAQDELTVDRLIQRIEERLRPIDSIEVSQTFRVLKRRERQIEITAWIQARPGRALYREYLLWEVFRGVYASESYFDRREFAAWGCFGEGRKGQGLFYGWKTPLGPAAQDNPMAAMVGFMFGLDLSVIDVALFPRMIGASCRDLRTVRMREGNRALVGIEGKRDIGFLGVGPSLVTVTWLFDAESLRAEGIEVDLEGKKARVRCEEYTRVNGVELPRRVEYQAPQGEGMSIEVVMDGFRSPATDGKIRPGWVDDPALPGEERASPETLRSRLDKDPRDGKILLALVGRVIDNFSQGRTQARQAARDLLPYFPKALEAHPNSSALATAYYCLLQSAGEAAKAETFAAGLGKRGKVGPGLACLLLQHRLSTSKYKDARAALPSLPERGAYLRFRRGIEFVCAAAEAKTPGEFAAIVEKALAGKPLPAALGLLNGLEPPVRRYGRQRRILAGKDGAFLDGLAATCKAPLRLLAARGYVAKGENKKAAKLFLRLAGDKEYGGALVPELEAFCRRAKDEAGPLLKLLGDRLTSVDLLLQALQTALKYTDGPTTAEQILSRLYKVLPEAGREYRSADWVRPVLETLVEAKREAEAKRLLLAYVNDSNASSLVWGKTKEIVVKIVAKDVEAKYRLLKAAHPFDPSYAQALSISNEDFYSFAKARVMSASFDERDVRALVAFVEDSSLRAGAKLPEVVGLLLRGIERFPAARLFRERLGDAYVYLERFKEAIGPYGEALRLRKGSSTVMVASPRVAKAVPFKEAVRWFDPSRPLIAKLAYAHSKAGDPAAARAAVDRFVRDSKEESDLKAAIEAYEFLKLPERVIRVRKKGFLRQLNQLGGRSWRRREFLHGGVVLVKAYLAAKRYRDAYVVADILREESAKSEGDDKGVKQVEEVRREVAKSFGEDDLLRAYYERKFPDPSDAERKKVADLLRRLQADGIEERDQAAQELKRLGPSVTPLLRSAMEKGGAELRGRVRELLLHRARKSLREEFLRAE